MSLERECFRRFLYYLLGLLFAMLFVAGAKIKHLVLIVGAGLLIAPVVFLDDGIRGGEDRARRPVILFKQNDFGAGKILFKIEQVVDHGAAPAVNILVNIADHANVFMRVRQNARDLVLRFIGVLVFVDRQISPAILQERTNLLRMFQ